MASITITVDDALVGPLLTALKWKYPEVDIEGLTLAQQGKRYIRTLLRDVYREYKVDLATREASLAYFAAQNTAADNAEQEAAGIKD